MEGTNSTPMEQALRNPIVLQQILQNKSIKAKTMRLVCKQWNEIILTLPEPRFRLDLNAQGCCDSNSFQIFCNHMEPNLARSIKLDEYCDRGHQKETTVQAAGAMLIQVCDKFGDIIQFLDLEVDNNVTYKIFCETSYWPNLKVVIICRCDGELLNPDPLPIRPKLVSIYLNVGEHIKINERHSLGQLLIDSAPNLQKLELSCSTYFPDLRRSGKLRVLKIPRGPLVREFLFEKFSRVLEQVADTLEVLSIGDFDSIYPAKDWDIEGADVKNHFQMPRMPRLKNFRNEHVGIFTYGDALQDLSAERCPKLRSLYLANNCDDNFNIDRLLRRVIENKTRLNVTSLTCQGVNDPSLIANLKTSFPHLERLELLGVGHLESTNDKELEFGPSLKACAALGLSHFGLELFNYPDTLSGFLTCFLDNSTLFKRLKTFWVNNGCICMCHTPSSYFDKDSLKETPNGWNLMRQFLLTFVGIKSAVICPWFKKDAWWERIHQFIQENNIPVEFKWCENERCIKKPATLPTA